MNIHSDLDTCLFIYQMLRSIRQISVIGKCKFTFLNRIAGIYCFCFSNCAFCSINYRNWKSKSANSQIRHFLNPCPIRVQMGDDKILRDSQRVQICVKPFYNRTLCENFCLTEARQIDKKSVKNEEN